jgi:ATP-dependent RNA helicase DeaD
MTSDNETLTAAALAAIHPALASALAKQGYVTLTPVQIAVLDDNAVGNDLLVSAQTGSGKTVAFGLAIAPTLLGQATNFEFPERPLGLIIAPTRELALQVERELSWLYADAGVTTASCVGGMDMRKERRALERGAHVVVGTPGRLRDHITRGSLDLSNLRAVVLDEADEMLDLGFREDLEFILAAAPRERRTLMFSATVPKPIAHLAKTFQRDAVRIAATAATERHADIDYQMVIAQSHERESAIINTLLYFDSGSAIVFCHTREAVKHLAAQLADRGFTVVALSGELSQSERTNALQSMRDGRARVCVATDVAARGIDLPNLDLVIHADMPTNPDILLHRSGRTGRAGRKGVCVLIVPVRRFAAATRVLDIANVDATSRGAPTAAEIDARNREQILQAAIAAPQPDESETGLVAELLSRVSPEQLAAAYLRQQIAARPVPEDISETQVPVRTGKLRERGRNSEAGPAGDKPRREREDMTGSAWFSLSIGRKDRADPKWILPLICKAGGVTRDDVGSIKIFEDETRFEISAKKSGSYAEKIARDGSGESGATIVPSVRITQEAPRAGPAVTGKVAPKYKVRSDKGEKLGPEPVAGARPERDGKPFRPDETWNKVKPKDKFKTKSKNKHEFRAKVVKGPKSATKSSKATVIRSK